MDENAINEAFESLFDAMQEKEEDGKTILYRDATGEHGDIFDDITDLKKRRKLLDGVKEIVENRKKQRRMA